MSQPIHSTAQRLLNLYRQAHVIVGGWAAVNDVFVKEADESVLTELKTLPCGETLVKHILNLKNGKTPMDSIETDLLPYGGLMQGSNTIFKLSESDYVVLQSALQNFEPTANGLKQIVELPLIQNIGENWQEKIKSALSQDMDLKQKWDTVIKTWTAYNLWDSAQTIIHSDITERIKAQVQADMLDYETYLPMFGQAGTDLLVNLRNIISTMK